MKSTLFGILAFLSLIDCAFAQVNIQLEADLASNFNNYYGQADCDDFSAELDGMSVYRLYIRTGGEQIKPFQLWGNQFDLMEFIPFGEVYNNSNPSYTNCADLSCDTGWGTGGPIPFIDTWISMGGTPDGQSDGILAAGCCLTFFDDYIINIDENTTASAFLQFPASVVLPNQTLFPLGQTMTTSEGPVSITTLNVGQYSYEMDEVFIAQVVTDGPMVARVNFSYMYEGTIFEHTWVQDAGLEISFGYCFDSNACNYSPDFEVVGTGFESCEYDSCTPCGGCMDEEATNFNPYAELDNGSCFYPGCTFNEALNFDPIAYEEDGSCILDNSTCGQAFSIDSTNEPTLFGINEGEDGSSDSFCWSTQNESETVWFSFLATSPDMYVLTEPYEDAILDVVVLDDCAGSVISCVEDAELYYSGLSNLLVDETYIIGIRGSIGDVFELEVGNGIVGCNNQNAINFNPNYDIAFGCDYAGCTDPAACNFWNGATVDDGSCFFAGAILEGRVYRDFNLNNTIDSGEPLTNYPLTILPTNDVVFTNSNGYYYYETTEEGPYTIIADQSVGQFDPEYANTEIEDEGFCTLALRDIRLISLNEGESYLCAGFPVIESIFCIEENLLQFNVANDGDVPITAQVTVTITPSNFFEFTQLPEGAVLIGDNQFSLSSLLNSGENASFASTIVVNDVPNVEVIIEYDVVILNPNDEVIGQENFLVPAQFLCSYDPNDKLAYPVGYETPHFILNEPIHYLINFQNTGNYPAVDVLIVDSLDISTLDISTFELLETSHDALITLSEDGLLSALFAHIQLPDSSSNPAESVGFLSFRIEPYEDLSHLTEIENSASIFFDINEPIITNTTFHTIYECTNELAAFEFVEDPVCFGTEIEATNDGMYIEEYSWTLDGNEVGTEAYLLLEGLESGTSTLELTVSNPLCVANASGTFTVLNEIEVLIQQNGNQLYYAGFESGDFQWFFNGEPIEGATEEFIEITEDGTYHLELTNTQGCLGVSGELDVIFDHVAEQGIAGVNVYPNPVQDYLTIEFSDASQRTIELYSADGKLVLTQVVNTSTHYLDMQDLASGVYTMSVMGEGTMRVIK